MDKHNAELRSALKVLVDAGERVLDGLDERISRAPRNSVPVFDGIASLHMALTQAKELLK